MRQPHARRVHLPPDEPKPESLAHAALAGALLLLVVIALWCLLWAAGVDPEAVR